MIYTLSFFASVLDVTINIIIFLLVLSLVICIHELGHLFFAKRAGILCHEYSFGMGPRLWSIKKGETRYSIRAIPFGGFVSMAGEELEAEVVKVGERIGLVLDDKQNISKIVLNIKDKRYPEMIETLVEDFDLSDVDNLNINGLKVNEKAMYVYPKDEMQIAPKGRRFNDKSKGNRFLTTFGGPLMNFVLAFLIYLVIGLFAGVADKESTVIGGISENLPADQVLYEGDKIISINGVNVDSWVEGENSVVEQLSLGVNEYVFVIERNGQELVKTIQPMHFFFNLGFSIDGKSESLIISQPLYINTELMSGDKVISIDGQTFNTLDDLIVFAENYADGSSEENPTTIVVERDGQSLTFTYKAYSQEVLETQGYDIYFKRLGIESSTKFSFFGSFGTASSNFLGAGTSIFSTLRLLFASDEVGIRDLSGFVGIFSLVRQASSQGLIALFSFIALLSVNLGILNLLPIPALDGGRIVFIGYEAITKRKPNQKVENLLHTAVFFLLLGLMIYVTYHDILRLFGLK
ncbi:RIP metalloprotease RseP [Hujiaoplasma nucleasis]|uniref:RIP metalloprotease RseP n=1 Tax=Hujiaoplasma nucleasis TaxID=2725268 RepID=A0A7L6N1W6_9MOLU|nr:RIP metalloprotease RseP [Hujiaoplasma nucleasis]QLY40246.1 RIP metalloprotease RseP [Hujiaoplasma nucleasis]